MKKLILFLLLLFQPGFAQYYRERTAEKSFENSDMFFKSHYLNTFALPGFKEVASGFISEPFLDLYNNPASLPDLNGKEIRFYMDFRGDREIPRIVEWHMPLNYYSTAYLPLPDSRWLSTARVEPEPAVSLGLLLYPFKGINQSFFLGATYQLIHREEKYYSLPYFIFNSRYGYDTFNSSLSQYRDGGIPIIDRSAQRDEMLTSGHLFSAFMGLRVLSNLTLGLSLNGVIHSRDGQYLNLNNSEYGSTSQNIYTNLNSQSKDEKYRHLDFSAGLCMDVSSRFTLGIKGGILSGKANQSYNQINTYFYQNKVPGQPPDWSYSFSDSYTGQTWLHKGTTKYFGINFLQRLGKDKEIRGFYRYGRSSINLSSTSEINDTTNFSYRWIYGDANMFSQSNGYSFMHDNRSGSGLKTMQSNEVMLNIKWDISLKSTLLTGFYYNNSKSLITDLEPALITRYSEYNYNSYLNNNALTLNDLKEDKILQWDFSEVQWTFQIPVMLYFRIEEKFGLLLGINRILRDWETNDLTLAIFKSRERDENGVIKKETDFGERYGEPSKKITENTTDLITRFDFFISPDLKVNLLLDPDFDGQFHFVQWWISFEANL